MVCCSKYTRSNRICWFFWWRVKTNTVLPEEVDVILKHMGVDERRVDIDFEIGETVKVKEGPFANFTGYN